MRPAMHPYIHARKFPNKPAYLMAGSGEIVTYGQLDRQSNRIAQLFRSLGLQAGDHVAIFMENNARFFEICWGAQRSGLIYTAISSRLTAPEVDYIVGDCGAKLFVTSKHLAERAAELRPLMGNVPHRFMVDSPIDGYASWEEAVARQPETPIADQTQGHDMLYSSGTTGRPKGILRPLPEDPPANHLPIFSFLLKLWKYRDGMIYLSPAPLYHSAPQAAVGLTIRSGGTAVIMEKFDPEAYLALVPKYRITHSQLVPTMFSRMLKLPEAARKKHDLSSLEIAIHAAAPCPVQVKEQMIQWWGPIIDEYYGATEGLGFTACNSAEWLAHKGTVGKVLLGKLHVLDDAMVEQPVGTAGTLWFETATPFEYFNDPGKTKEARSPDGSMSTVGDVG